MNIWELGFENHLISFIKNPADIKSTQEMYRIFSKNESFQKAAEKTLLANESFKKLYNDWYFPSSIDLEKLSKLPENTFGSIYARHMIANNLNPNFISEFEERNLLSYLWMRAKHIHDIGHVLTGFDTSLFGEISIKGFELAQYKSPSTAATVGAGLLSLSCLMPDQVGSIYESFFKGYELGKKYPLLMSIKFDQYWEYPYDEMKRHLNLP